MRGDNPPEGWDNPEATGTLMLLSENRAQFDADGKTAYFKRGDEKPLPCRD